MVTFGGWATVVIRVRDVASWVSYGERWFCVEEMAKTVPLWCAWVESLRLHGGGGVKWAAASRRTQVGHAYVMGMV